MLEIIFGKIMLGVTLAAPIGPVSIEMIKRGLEKGFWASFRVRLGGAVGNVLCLVASYLSLSALIKQPLVIGSIGLIGALYLVYMGLKNIFKKHVNLNSRSASPIVLALENSPMIVGFILALANPVSIVFWLGIFAANFNPDDISILNFTLDLMIIAGVLIWGAMLSGTLALGHQILNERNILWVTKGAGVLMLYFGLKFTLLNVSKLFGDNFLTLYF